MIKNNRLTTLIWMVLIISSSFFPIINVHLSKKSIDSINSISVNISYYWISIKVLLVIAVVNIMYAMLSSISTIIYNKINNEVMYIIEKDLYEKLRLTKLENFEKNTFYNKLVLAKDAISKNGLNVVKYFFEIVKEIIVIIGVMWVLALISWSLPVAVIFSTIPGMIAIIIGKSRRNNISWINSETFRKMSYFSSLFFYRPLLKEIRLFDAGAFIMDKWSEFYNANFKNTLNINILEEKVKLLGVILLQIANMAVGVYLLSKISSNSITIGSYISLTAAITTIQVSIGNIWQNIGQIFEVSLSTRILLDVLSIDNNDICDKSNVDNMEDMKKVESIESIEMRDITFYYPSSNKKAIRNVNIKINKGERIAIVGSNGAGKSTLVNILLGLFTEFEGELLINGIKSNYIDKTSFNKLVSAVFQDFGRYQMSLKDNLLLRNSKDELEVENVSKYIYDVGLSTKFNNGNLDFNTILSKEYENGTELSGGEWQKVAIARSMIKSAEFIVLDEPTSALDPLAELEIFKLFNSIANGRTTLMISHRLGITRYADKIIVLSDGRIIEAGNHDYLISLNGEYKTMYESQSNWYK